MIGFYLLQIRDVTKDTRVVFRILIKDSELLKAQEPLRNLTLCVSRASGMQMNN